jgi:uncharacterized protein YbjT (DUF2867 family)
MKYVITGSLGHISKPLVEKLTAAGNDVTVISSNAERAAAIEALGAKAAIGSVQDIAFLTKTFTGADAVYTMVPPTWSAADWKKHIASVGAGYAEAIKAAGVKKVVNLSSIGAHMPEGCGPVSGLYFVEQSLNAVEGTDVLHLRPAFFYHNLLANIGMIKHMGIIGGNYGENAKLIMVDPSDIADVAAEALLHPDFTGKSVKYISSTEILTSEIASAIGKEIGKPDLKWINFADADSKAGMIQAGLSEEVASNYVEMGSAMRSGEMGSDFIKHGGVRGKTSFNEFAKVFAHAFSNS